MSLADALGWAVLLLGALVGSVIGAVAGFGAGITLVPLIAWVFGIRAVAPVLTVTMLIGNLSRIWWSRRQIDRPVALRFLLGGGRRRRLYVGTSSEWLRWIIGGFLIAAVPLRRILLRRYFVIRRRHFPFLGATIGVLSALAGDDRPGDDAVLPGLRSASRRLHRHRGRLHVRHAHHPHRRLRPLRRPHSGDDRRGRDPGRRHVPGRVDRASTARPHDRSCLPASGGGVASAMGLQFLLLSR